MNLPLISINSLQTTPSYIISIILIALSFVVLSTKKYNHNNIIPKPLTVGLSAIFIFSIHLIGYKIFYNFHTNVVGMIILVMLVGLPYSIISMSVVLLAETIFLTNGSIQMLGINIISIAFFGSFVTLLVKNKKIYLTYKNIEKDKLNGKTLFALHVVAIYAFLSIHFIWIFISGFISFSKNLAIRSVILETMYTQMPFAIVESIITLLFLTILYFVKPKYINKFLLSLTILLTTISLILKTRSDIVEAFFEAYNIAYIIPNPIIFNANTMQFIYIILAEISIFSIVSFIAYSINKIKKIYKHN